MNERKARWMKISRREEPLPERKRKSQHYTPRKSENSSNEEDGGMHEMVKELSNFSIQGSNQLSFKQVESEIQVPSILSITPRKKDKKYSQISHEQEEREQRKRQTQVKKPPSTQDIDSLFKYYLAYVESVEKDFEAQKIQIDRMLLSQYEKIREIRNFVIDTFSLKKTRITSKPLKKLISNRQMEKEKPQKKFRQLARGFSQRKSSQRRNFEVENPQSQLGLKSNEFNRIFQALKQLKIDLNDCREIRESENFGRNKKHR